jgi:hypothetical protein
MRWTGVALKTRALFADGEVVWFWRPDAGVKSAEAIPPATVANKPGHRGEHEGNSAPITSIAVPPNAKPGAWLPNSPDLDSRFNFNALPKPHDAAASSVSS